MTRFLSKHTMGSHDVSKRNTWDVMWLQKVTTTKFGQFRSRLAAARERKDLNHREIAKLLGISRPHYTLIENGQRNPSTTLLFRIAALLEIPVEDVMSTESERSA